MVQRVSRSVLATLRSKARLGPSLPAAGARRPSDILDLRIHYCYDGWVVELSVGLLGKNHDGEMSVAAPARLRCALPSCEYRGRGARGVPDAVG